MQPALDLGSVSMLMRISPSKNRSAYLANFSLITNIVGQSLSYVLAGMFLAKISPMIASLNVSVAGSPLNRFHILFLVSGLLRFLVLIVFLPKISDPEAYTTQTMLQSIFKPKITVPLIK